LCKNSSDSLSSTFFSSRCLFVSGNKKNIIRRFKNITNAGIIHKKNIELEFIIAQNKGPITNHIQKVAHINHKFLVLSSSVEISEI
jgi:hypothetical protein